MRLSAAQILNTSTCRLYECVAVFAVLLAAPPASATLLPSRVRFSSNQAPAAGCSAIGRPSADCTRNFGSVFAGASYGDVWAGYELSYVPASEWIRTVQGYGRSGFEDMLTLRGESGRGYVQFILDGTFQPGGDSPRRGHEDFTITVAGIRNEVTPSCCGERSQEFQYQTGLDPITFGKPFGLGMTANVSILTDGEGAPRGRVDARIAGIRVYDAAGQAIPFSLSAKSGAGYTVLAPTPEPSALVLLATAVCGIAVAAARKRRARRA